LICYSAIYITVKKGKRHVHSKVDFFFKFCFLTGE